MRADMSKVIVERPRRSRPPKIGSAYPRGHLKNQWAPNLEDAPRTEAMGGTYAEKWLNENLQPLVRFLRSRVGRLWDDVHSEIAARISCKSAVQKHVLDHLREYVVKDVEIEESRIRCIPYIRYRREELESVGMRFRFYVDPATRVLRLAPVVSRKRRVPSVANQNRRILSRDRELRRIQGVWYEIEIVPIPSDQAMRAACFDVVERTTLDSSAFAMGVRENALWRTSRYATKKRQLSTREVAHHRLRTTESAKSRTVRRAEGVVPRSSR